VTSPPYFGLRDYGCAGQIGLESTPDAYVAELVAVFREVRRVLRDDGTLWLNLGDSYASGKGTCYNPGGGESSLDGHAALKKAGAYKLDRGNKSTLAASGLKPKDLVGIPWRVAFALQADGWYLRQDIIWAKPSPFPESVKDRCTKSHEYIFLLSKSAQYYYNADAIKVKAVTSVNSVRNGRGNSADCRRGRIGTFSDMVNRRDVWTISTKPYKGSHFAVFPPEIPRLCILAGSKPGDTILDPFGGSGTTGEVAASEGRKAILIELNPEYVKLAKNRGGLFYTSNPNFQAGGTL
jgi:DNA modification methylase